MTEQELTDLFYEWFVGSYPNAKPGNHTVMSHVAFAAHVIDKCGYGDSYEVEFND